MSDISIENNARMDRLLMSNPEMERKVKKIIRDAIREAKKEVESAAHSAIGNDPRNAYKAVRSAVYNQILGGNVNIISSRRAGSVSGYNKPRTLRKGQRGGNRMSRSRRTEEMEGYTGADRSFILRWLDSGTKMRASRYGNRGQLVSTGWFATSSRRAIEHASSAFEAGIEKLIQEEFNS